MGKVLHASRSGYFPTCIRDDPTSGGNVFFGLMEMSVTQGMEMFWRVKKWNMSWSFSAVDGGGATHAGSATTMVDVSVKHGLSSEEDMVCDPIELSGLQGYPWINANVFPITDFPAQTGDGYLGGGAIIRNVNNATTKGWVFTSATTGQVRFWQSFYLTDSGWSNDPYTGDHEIIILPVFTPKVFSSDIRETIPGGVFNYNGVTAQAVIDYPSSAGAGFISSITFNFSLVANEYWSYGGTYDTATGLPL